MFQHSAVSSRCRRWTTGAGIFLGALLVASPLAIVVDATSASATTTGPGVNAANCPGGVLVSHPAIAISSDTGFTVANGVTGGSGTAADPYVISCWSIQVVASGPSGISVSGSTTKSFVIHDATVTGPGSGSSPTGISTTGTTGSVTVHNVTVTAVVNALVFSNVAGPLLVQNNRTDTYNVGSQPGGIEVFTAGNAPTAVVTNNTVLAAGGTSFGVLTSAGGPVVIQANTIVGTNGASIGISLANGNCQLGSVNLDPTLATATGNDVSGFGKGIFLFDGTATGNTLHGNGSGVGFNLVAGNCPGNNSVVASNTIESNAGPGIDVTAASQSLIRNNTILDNGSAGILSNPAQPAVPGSSSNLIDGNTIGGSDFGIAFAFEATNNTVQNTHWADGHQSFVRFGDTATIVDAGSAQRGVVNTPTSFADWIAHVAPGSIAPAACDVHGCTGDDVFVGATGGTFDFGDKNPQGQENVKALSAADLANVGTPLTHSYAATGTYNTTLTVNAVDTNGATVPLSGTSQVTIVSPPPTSLVSSAAGSAPWPMLGNTPDRSFFNGSDSAITKSSVGQLVPKWRFPTNFSVTASPAVATVNVSPPGVGGTPTPHKLVFDGAFDGEFYAIDAATGLPVWQKCLVTSAVTTAASCDPQYPGNPSAPTDYGVITSSPEVATVTTATGATQQEILAAANATMNALDPVTGKVIWTFNGGATGYAGEATCPQVKGQGCEDLTYEIESSPVVIGNTVFFGIDCNGMCQKGGGIYALDARDGHMLWFFDPSAGQAFAGTPLTTSYNPKMNGPATAGTCGGVWTSPAVDVADGLLYASTANCAVNPLPPYEEAVFALHLGDGSPAWQYQPRLLDAIDMDFSATPNVFKLGSEDVVGAASKDGTYTLFDAASGGVLWTSKVALGGSFGGFYNATVDGSKIYLTSAIGEASAFAATPQEDSLKGREYALDARTGNILWRSYAGAPTLGQNSAVNGVYFTGGLDHLLHAWDADTGNLLTALPLAGASSSGPAIAGGEVFIGAGTGATYRSAVGPCDPIFGAACPPAPLPAGEYGQGIWGFCLAGDPACAASISTIAGNQHPTKLTYTGATSGDANDPVTLSANLADTTIAPAPQPVANRTIAFSLYDQSCTATTDANGNASCTLTLDERAGNNTVTAMFLADGTYQSANSSTPFTVNHEETTLTYTGPTTFKKSASSAFSATLTEDGTTPLVGRTVTFTVGSGTSAQICSTVTDAKGNVTCTLRKMKQSLGQNTLTTTFSGDNYYRAASTTIAVLIQ